MSPNAFLHKFAVLIGAAMIITGVVLGIIAANQLPTLPGVENSVLAAVLDSPQSPLNQPASPLWNNDPVPAQPVAHSERTLIIALGDNLPVEFTSAASDLVIDQTDAVIVPLDSPRVMVQFGWEAEDGEAIYQQFFAAATRFDTIDLNVRSLHIERAWRGNASRFQSIAVLESTLPALEQILGEAGESVVAYTEMDELID